MPAKFLVIDKKANKNISKFPLWVHNKIGAAFNLIKENPMSGVKLHGKLVELYKFRVGDYRIIYQFDQKNKVVTIVKVEHRQGVYK